MRMRRGSILAETVMVMPLLMFLVFGVVQFALIWTAEQMTAYAAFCATRAIMVIRPEEQQKYAKDAAEVALSWMCIAERDGAAGGRVDIPGWGGIPGSASASDRIRVKVLENGSDSHLASVEVKFKYPLLIPGMAVNKIISNKGTETKDASEGPDFYGELHETADGEDKSIDGHWPWLELTEVCVLPMPYSTERFPSGGFSGTSPTGGGS